MIIARPGLIVILMGMDKLNPVPEEGSKPTSDYPFRLDIHKF